MEGDSTSSTGSTLNRRKISATEETETTIPKEVTKDSFIEKTKKFINTIRKNPQQLLEKVLDDRILLKRIVYCIFGLAIASFLSVCFSDTKYHITTWLYVKLFGVVAFGAFYGLWIQAKGLVGEHGISPISTTLKELSTYVEAINDPNPRRYDLKSQPVQETEKIATYKKQFLTHWTPLDTFLSKFDSWKRLKNFWNSYSIFPTLFWISTEDKFLDGLFIAGLSASSLLIIGIGPAPLLISVIYLCYLSFMHVFDEFLALQWDVLLLESSFLSFLLTLSSHGFRMFHVVPSQVSEPSKFVLFAIWWLVFRLMFCSGVVKLTSRDKTWSDLTAMSYHYMTQPLPTPISHRMHNLPLWLHKVETLGTFVIELALPLLMFGTNQTRLFAALSFTFLNATISITGNYGFFNILTIVLSTLMIEDRYWTLNLFATSSWSLPTLVWADFWNAPLFAVAAAFSIPLMNRTFRANILVTPIWVSKLHKSITSWYLMSNYGLFAVMTTKRMELVIEGSNDGQNWKPYEFKYKPGQLDRTCPIIPFHMPRLDWRMWFCAFSKYPNVPTWFIKLIGDLVEGKPDVLKLIARTPFDASDPPTMIRVMRYDYNFTTEKELNETGKVWTRTEKPPLFPGVLRFKPKDNIVKDRKVEETVPSN